MTSEVVRGRYYHMRRGWIILGGLARRCGDVWTVMVRKIRQPRAPRASDDHGRRPHPSGHADDGLMERPTGSNDAVTAAAAIVRCLLRDRELEQARLEGVQLAAREMAHLLNNDLAVAVGLIELLQERPDLPPHLRELLDEAAGSLDSAAQHVSDLQTVVRVATKATPAGLSLDLERSQTDR